MLSRQSSYRNWAENEIRDILEEYQVQPILFVGSGISQRYINGPSWDELLMEMASLNPRIDRRLEYYKQKYDDDFSKIGTEFADEFFEWAWEVEETDIFADSLYDHGDREMFLKYKVAEYFKELTPNNIDEIPDQYSEEIELLQDIGPHAIITTNYDSLLELIYPEYNPVVGEDVYGVDYTSMGDIFKIHGDVTDPESVIITERDYKNFIERKKYLTSKLLTYLAEHPVFVFGYRAEDDNIQRILSDIDLVLSKGEEELIKNIFHISYTPGIEDSDEPERHHSITTSQGRRIRIRSISAENFEWIFDSLGYESDLTGVKIKQLRRLLSNTYKIVTEDAPKREIQIELLQEASGEEELSKLVGIVPFEDSGEGADLFLRQILDDEESLAESIEDPNYRLKLATFHWLVSDILIDSRTSVLNFRSDRDELELNDNRRELLFRSSLNNYLQGTDWLVSYEGDWEEMLSRVISDLDSAEPAKRLQYDLLVLGHSDLMEKLRDNPELDYMSLDAENYVPMCEEPMETRLREYVSSSSNNIRYGDETTSVGPLLEDENETKRLLEEATNYLMDEPPNVSSTHWTGFRKLELINLSHHMPL